MRQAGNVVDGAQAEALDRHVFKVEGVRFRQVKACNGYRFDALCPACRIPDSKAASFISSPLPDRSSTRFQNRQHFLSEKLRALFISLDNPACPL